MFELDHFHEIADPAERFRAVGEALAVLQSRTTELGTIRRTALDELRAQGLTLAEISKLVNVSVARLSQIGASPRRPERALLSTSSTVIVGVPTEDAAYKEGPQRPVIHKDDAEFIKQISELAQSYGLGVEIEYLGPNDFIDLNRPGVVLTCGPRQSPWLEQILASDEAYSFLKDEEGWYLLDRKTNTKHRSPADGGSYKDYGYLGTLPRPDGNGTWLFAAGIHAPGSRGAALYLSEHISEIYAETRNSLWSCLVSCDYDKTTREVTNAELLEPIRRRGHAKSRR